MGAVPPVCDFGWKAVDFTLPGTDGRTYALRDVAGPNGTLIAFICNHCPYVKAIIGKLVRDAAELKELGIGTVAISSNDDVAYPQDGFEPMKDFARQHGFGFPYLFDATQDVARAYGAVCTPDLFGFNAMGELQYRGRFDSSGRSATEDARRDLFEAMKLIAVEGQGPREQVASIGCSIKWKAA
ncbi:MAG: thioredoxin family protein [Aestuariivirga sp.]